MAHVMSNPKKPPRTIWKPRDRGVLETVGEAWARRALAVDVKTEGAKTTSVIPMNRPVGRNAGEDFVHIIVRHGNEVITAFPRAWP